MSIARGVQRRTFRYLVLLVALVAVLAGSAFTGGTSVQAQGSSTVPACGIGLRLLVVTADGTEVALPAIESALRYLGTPYTLHIATQNPNALTPESLMDGCKARYNGIILTTASLAYTPDGGATWASALTPAEFQALESYERTYGVRQVTWFTFPTPDLGFQWGLGLDTTLSPLGIRLTSAGQAAFPYINNGSPLVIGTGKKKLSLVLPFNPLEIRNAFTYLAKPLDASTQTLLGDVLGNALIAVKTYPDGRQNLAMTFDSNPYLLHNHLFSYGVVNWVTKGLFIGEKKIYMSPQIDDVFIPDSRWTSSTPCGTPVDATGAELRITASDWKAVRNWQNSKRGQPNTADLRLTMAFNGVGAENLREALTTAARANEDDFYWVNHTYDHELLNAVDATTATWEIRENNRVAGELGLSRWNAKNIVTPEISGLTNPAFLHAAYEAGIRFLVSDTSKPGYNNPSPNTGIFNAIEPRLFMIPRRPNNMFFNVAIPSDWTSEYNCMYEGYWGKKLSYRGDPRLRKPAAAHLHAPGRHGSLDVPSDEHESARVRTHAADGPARSHVDQVQRLLPAGGVEPADAAGRRAHESAHGLRCLAGIGHALSRIVEHLGDQRRGDPDYRRRRQRSRELRWPVDRALRREGRPDHQRPASMNALDELTATLDRTHPQLLDRWEAAAVVESLGYSDRRVAESFGVVSTLSLGSLLLRAQRLHPGAAAATPPPVHSDPGETTLANAALSSLIYAMPWLLVFLAESWKPEILHLAPGLAAPLTLALMASLVISGGFVQAIARRAQFCVGIAQTGLARSTCLYLILAGLATASLVAAAGVLVGWYFSLFSIRFLVLAALYFIVATALWMHCAVLGVGRQSWRIPLVFLAGAAAFAAVRLLGTPTLVAQVAAICAALMCAAVQSRQMFAVSDHAVPIDRARVNPWIVAHGLLPYFLYGVLYFTFLIADRVAAGAAVASRGAAFTIPQTYKDGMDIALLTFLLAGAVVECCNLILMRGWRQAGHLPYGAGFAQGASRLLWRWHALTAVMVAAFAGIAFVVREVAEPLTRRSIDGLAGTILVVGDIGYLLFAVGLLNALALLSVDRVSSATRSLAAAVVINLVTGSILGHLFGALYASAGLAAGGAVFAVQTSRKLNRTLKKADTLYAAA